MVATLEYTRSFSLIIPSEEFGGEPQKKSCGDVLTRKTQNVFGLMERNFIWIDSRSFKKQPSENVQKKKVT